MTEETPDNAKPFSEMADRINLNHEHPFGGAFVVVPPGEGSEPLFTLMLDGQKNAAAFWGHLKATCEIALNELDRQARGGQQNWGR